jgi:hypothetical protein
VALALRVVVDPAHAVVTAGAAGAGAGGAPFLRFFPAIAVIVGGSRRSHRAFPLRERPSVPSDATQKLLMTCTNTLVIMVGSAVAP